MCKPSIFPLMPCFVTSRLLPSCLECTVHSLNVWRGDKQCRLCLLDAMPDWPEQEFNPSLKKLSGGEIPFLFVQVLKKTDPPECKNRLSHMCKNWGVSQLLAQSVSCGCIFNNMEVSVVGEEAFKSFERFQ